VSSVYSDAWSSAEVEAMASFQKFTDIDAWQAARELTTLTYVATKSG